MAYKLCKTRTVWDSLYDGWQLVAVCLVESSARQKDWALSHSTFSRTRQGYYYPCNILGPNTLLTAGTPLPFLVGVLQGSERRHTWITQDIEEAGCQVAVKTPIRPPFHHSRSCLWVCFSQAAVAQFLSWTFLCDTLITLNE
jgi:hypothetical protein